jgi:hypothetical protein
VPSLQALACPALVHLNVPAAQRCRWDCTARRERHVYNGQDVGSGEGWRPRGWLAGRQQVARVASRWQPLRALPQECMASQEHSWRMKAACMVDVLGRQPLGLLVVGHRIASRYVVDTGYVRTGATATGRCYGRYATYIVPVRESCGPGVCTVTKLLKVTGAASAASLSA